MSKRTRTCESYPKRRKPMVVLMVEGRNQTETLYFNHFITRNAYYILKVFSAEDTDPLGMAKKAEAKYRAFQMAEELGDKIYCLIDLDLSSKKIEQMEIAKKKYKRVNFVVSNPCFEVWLLYYFTEYPQTLSSSQKVKDALKKYVPEYTESMDIVEHKHLQDKLAIAINRAEKRQALYIDDTLLEKNPYTQIVDLIMTLIDCE